MSRAEVLVCAAGGYGSMLQFYAATQLLPRDTEFCFHDDAWKDDKKPLPKVYLESKCVVTRSIHNPSWKELPLMVPSFKPVSSKLTVNSELTQVSKYDTYSNSLGAKDLFIPTVFLKQNITGLNKLLQLPKCFGNLLVIKPNNGSGSKSVRLVSINNFDEDTSDIKLDGNDIVCQPYYPGSELIIDVVVCDNEVVWTARKSLERVGGRDSVIDLHITDDDHEQITNILSKWLSNSPDKIVTSRPKMALNIQCRRGYSGKWKIMEIDYRLSGSSIINPSYDRLIDFYYSRVGTPTDKILLRSVKLISLVDPSPTPNKLYYDACKAIGIKPGVVL